MPLNIGSVVVAFFTPGPMEMLIVAAIAVLLFGNRLPSVMRSMGQGLTEFRKGMRGIENEIQTATSPTRQKTYSDVDDRDEATAPKFEPPAAEPKADSAEPSDESK